jgi:hypothetical protein
MTTRLIRAARTGDREDLALEKGVAVLGWDECMIQLTSGVLLDDIVVNAIFGQSASIDGSVAGTTDVVALMPVRLRRDTGLSTMPATAALVRDAPPIRGPLGPPKANARQVGQLRC